MRHDAQNDYAGVVVLMGSNLSEHQAELIADHFQSATFLIDPDGKQEI